MPDDREGIFDTIIRNKSHYQKRAYQCIKCLVTLFSGCSVAHHLLLSTPEFKNKWEAAVAWLQEELERRPFGAGSHYSYNWSPPAPSNDSTNGYYLERSQSARITLSKAVLLIPEASKATTTTTTATPPHDPEQEETGGEEVGGSPSSSLSSSQSQATVFETEKEVPRTPGEETVERPSERTQRRPDRRRRMALTRPDVTSGSKPDVCDGSSGQEPGGRDRVTGQQVRAPSPIPVVDFVVRDWSQLAPMTVKWPSEGRHKVSSGNSWWDKSLEAGGVVQQEVEEVDEVPADK